MMMRRAGSRFRDGADQIIKPFYLDCRKPVFRFLLVFRLHTPLDEFAHLTLPLVEQRGVDGREYQYLLAATLQVWLALPFRRLLRIE